MLDDDDFFGVFKCKGKMIVWLNLGGWWIEMLQFVLGLQDLVQLFGFLG